MPIGSFLSRNSFKYLDNDSLRIPMDDAEKKYFMSFGIVIINVRALSFFVFFSYYEKSCLVIYNFLNKIIFFFFLRFYLYILFNEIVDVSRSKPFHSVEINDVLDTGTFSQTINFGK